MLALFRAGLAGGIGLAGTRERWAELGGTLEVQSGESGSVIQATRPIAACDSNDAKAINAIIRSKLRRSSALQRHRCRLRKSQKPLLQFHARPEDSRFNDFRSNVQRRSQFPARPSFPFLQYECVFQRGV